MGQGWVPKVLFGSNTGGCTAVSLLPSGQIWNMYVYSEYSLIAVLLVFVSCIVVYIPSMKTCLTVFSDTNHGMPNKKSLISRIYQSRFTEVKKSKQNNSLFSCMTIFLTRKHAKRLQFRFCFAIYQNLIVSGTGRIQMQKTYAPENGLKRKRMYRNEILLQTGLF